MKKGGMEFKFVNLVLILAVVLLLMGALYSWVARPAKRTFDPIASNLEQEAGEIGKITGKLDRDKDNVPDEADRCCNCYEIGLTTVGPDGCAPNQKPSTCPGPCESFG